MEGPSTSKYGVVELVDESDVVGRYSYREIAYEGNDEDEVLETDASQTRLREEHVTLQQILGESLREQERMRTRFTRALLLVFGLVVAFALVASVTPYWANAKDALLITLPGITGFVGFAVGFYYLTVLWPPRGR